MDKRCSGHCGGPRPPHGQKYMTCPRRPCDGCGGPRPPPGKNCPICTQRVNAPFPVDSHVCTYVSLEGYEMCPFCLFSTETGRTRMPTANGCYQPLMLTEVQRKLRNALFQIKRELNCQQKETDKAPRAARKQRVDTTRDPRAPRAPRAPQQYRRDRRERGPADIKSVNYLYTAPATDRRDGTRGFTQGGGRFASPVGRQVGFIGRQVGFVRNQVGFVGGQVVTPQIDSQESTRRYCRCLNQDFSIYNKRASEWQCKNCGDLFKPKQ